MTTTTHAAPAPTAPPTRRRLPRRARQAVLVTHIVSAGSWLGIDIAMGVLVLVASTSAEPSTRGVALRAVELVAVWPLLVVGLLTLASGVTLGLGTAYGLTRYRWVLVKLAITLVLCGVVAFALPPMLAQASAAGTDLLTTGSTTWAGTDLVYPPVVSSAALVVAVVLSVVKPWGRRRSARR